MVKKDEKVLKSKLKKGGFTLVEVILVVAIITIISAIAVPQVGKYLNKANKSKVIGAIAELNNTSISFSVEHNGNSPTSLSELFDEQGDLRKLGIGLNSNGNFKIGNIEGNIVLENGEIFAKISATSKAFPNEEIRR